MISPFMTQAAQASLFVRISMLIAIVFSFLIDSRVVSALRRKRPRTARE